MPACPWHRGASAGARGTGHSEHWRNPNSQIVLIGKPRDWPESQKDFEAPQIARPFGRTPSHPCDPPRLAGMGARGICRPSSVPPAQQLSEGLSHRPRLPTRPPCSWLWPSILSLPRVLPPTVSSGTPLGPSLRHQLETPTCRTPMSPCHRRRPAFAAAVFASAQPLNSRSPARPVPGLRL
uniref:Uncharacterized protein n=1 Tax=Myotis myotis TaxID=51298 RepID=A0A7J7QTF8_MYOMY|nr:hypothetical protein mMyoMyo1_011832 [Myotis myotis]